MAERTVAIQVTVHSDGDGKNGELGRPEQRPRTRKARRSRSHGDPSEVTTVSGSRLTIEPVVQAVVLHEEESEVPAEHKDWLAVAQALGLMERALTPMINRRRGQGYTN